MLYQNLPENFNSKFDVVGCFIERNNKILLLHRQRGKPQENTWGIPAGKVNKNEDFLDALIREVNEETGIHLQIRTVQYIDKVYTRFPKLDFVFHMYKTHLLDNAVVAINTIEHQGFRWVTSDQALALPLMEDVQEYITEYYLKSLIASK